MTKTMKTYRMRMRYTFRSGARIEPMVEVKATNAWDAEAAAVAQMKREHGSDPVACYALSKRRV